MHASVSNHLSLHTESQYHQYLSEEVRQIFEEDSESFSYLNCLGLFLELKLSDYYARSLQQMSKLTFTFCLPHHFS